MRRIQLTVVFTYLRVIADTGGVHYAAQVTLLTPLQTVATPVEAVDLQLLH